MTKHEVKEYLTKIYQLPVKRVMTANFDGGCRKSAVVRDQADLVAETITCRQMETAPWEAKNGSSQEACVQACLRFIRAGQQSYLIRGKDYGLALGRVRSSSDYDPRDRPAPYHYTRMIQNARRFWLALCTRARTRTRCCTRSLQLSCCPRPRPSPSISPNREGFDAEAGAGPSILALQCAYFVFVGVLLFEPGLARSCASVSEAKFRPSEAEATSTRTVVLSCL